MRKNISKNSKKFIKNMLVKNNKLSENEICFRKYLKKYHPNKYKQLIELESKKENKTITIELYQGNVNDVKNLPKGWKYKTTTLRDKRMV
jgi:hypothetical protein